jgi:hypothetical protein
MPGSDDHLVRGPDALDPARVDELRVFTREELKVVAAEVIRSVSAGIEAAHVAAASGDMRGLAQAAHAGRNEALMVGARALADDFGQAEIAANAGDARAAREAIARVESSWSTVRPAVEQLPMHVGSA